MDTKVDSNLYFNTANCITRKLEATPKGKNLLPLEQILSIRVAPNKEGELLGLSL